jgi:diguanylate cyclase (GGDEF)-like protein
MVAIIRNITERKIFEQTLLSGAMRDDLTGLPNRSLLMEKVAQSIARKKANPDYNFALLFVDLDQFKQVNDSLGHLVGDQLLVETASKLRAILRSQDTVARLGGDEFGLLLPDIASVTDAIEVASRLQASLGQPLRLENQPVLPSASIGIAFSHRVYDSLETMLKDADSAMYQAKTSGRSRYVVFDAGPDQAW